MHDNRCTTKKTLKMNRQQSHHPRLAILPKLEPTEDFSFSLPPFPTTKFQHITTATAPPLKRPRTRTFPTSVLARQRRARLSDKTRCLQKLIPLDRQMDIATLYEETFKYVKFLEAQVTLLKSMPIKTPPSPPLNDVCGGLGRLNRQQMLQVLMSSQVAQTVMYTNGWCVFSAEQLPVDRGHMAVEQRFI